MFVAYVILGVGIGDLPEDNRSLLAVAAKFMPAAALLFFAVAGAIFAIATTINAVFLIATSGISAVADDRVLPGLLSKKNRFGTEVWTVWVMAVIVVILILAQPPLDELMSAFGVANMLIYGLLIIPMFSLEKKFPKSFAKAIIRPSKPVLVVVSVLAGIMAMWQILSVVIATPYVVLLLVAAYAVCYGYFFIRVYWLKSKGFDLLAKMREVPALWAEQEGWPVKASAEPVGNATDFE
jgi:APA family basic amino acid/polyamine antiporter